MQNIRSISFFNNQILKPIKLIPGQSLMVEVLEQNSEGVLLLLGGNRITAKTDLKLPVGARLKLYVNSINKDQIVLSIAKNDQEINKILSMFNFKSTELNKKIIEKLVEKNLQITRKNIAKAGLLIDKLPIENDLALELITDLTLFSAIFGFLKEENIGISLFFRKKKKYSKITEFEIDILFDSIKLGYIFINIYWSQKLIINMYCSENSTCFLFKNKISELKEKLQYISDLEINIIFEKEIFDIINKKYLKNNKSQGIDLWI